MAGAETAHNSLDILANVPGSCRTPSIATLMLSVLVGQPVMIQFCDLVAAMIIYQGSKMDEISIVASAGIFMS